MAPPAPITQIIVTDGDLPVDTLELGKLGLGDCGVEMDFEITSTHPEVDLDDMDLDLPLDPMFAQLEAYLNDR